MLSGSEDRLLHLGIGRPLIALPNPLLHRERAPKKLNGTLVDEGPREDEKHTSAVWCGGYGTGNATFPH